MLNQVEFGCVGAEIKWDTVCGFVVLVVVVVFHRKIRPTQLWVELSWVVANSSYFLQYIQSGSIGKIEK